MGSYRAKSQRDFEFTAAEREEIDTGAQRLIAEARASLDSAENT